VGGAGRKDQLVGDAIAIVSKSYFLHERDESGGLKAITVELSPGEEVKLIPLPEGEIKLLTDPEKGYEILSAHIAEPKITADEIRKYGKDGAIAGAVEKLFEISDIKESFRPRPGNKGKAP